MCVYVYHGMTSYNMPHFMIYSRVHDVFTSEFQCAITCENVCHIRVCDMGSMNM